MRKQIKIGVDLDGCLADFNTRFIELIANQTGIVLPPVSDSYPDVWAYHRAGGVSPEQDKKLWQHIGNSSDFWYGLPSLPGAEDALAELQRLQTVSGWSVYFITARNGRAAKAQTEQWLEDRGIANPTVLISERKGFVARGLDLDSFIDDRPENCADVLGGSLVKVYMIDRPYNREHRCVGLTVVESVSEATKQEVTRYLH